MMITLRATLPLLSYLLPRASRTPESAWLLPDIIFRIFNTAICAPYSNHSLSIAANLGLWQGLQSLPLLPNFCLHTHIHCIPRKSVLRAVTDCASRRLIFQK